jgi:GNAT superfamily N-acetyltransferase
MARKDTEGTSGDDPEVTVRPLSEDDWPVIAELFGPNGVGGGCWCMWPRVPRGGKLWDECKGERNRDAFRRLVQAGEVHGVLAFAGDQPVGWCSFGPREDFPRLDTVRVLRHECGAGTWSIVCFYIKTAWRRRGMAGRLLEAATARAFALGARAVEGYPVLPKEPGVPAPAAFAWMGVPALFEAAGYQEVPRPEASRPIYLKTTSAAGDRP